MRRRWPARCCGCGSGGRAWPGSTVVWAPTGSPPRFPPSGPVRRMRKRRPAMARLDVRSVTDRLAALFPSSPLDDLRRNNEDLIRALDDLRQQKEQLVAVNAGLEETNQD